MLDKSSLKSDKLEKFRFYDDLYQKFKKWLAVDLDD